MLLSVQDARQQLLLALSPVGTGQAPLAQVAGRVLAEDVHAPRDLPPFDNSSMDGFALRAADVQAARPDQPVTLHVVADIPAGQPTPVVLHAGQAARIMTGAALPAGADAVVPVEDTSFDNRDAGTPAPDEVGILRSVRPGDYVRPRGEDLRAGQLVLAKGTKLRPQDVGMLAMLGLAEVRVYHQPRVAILSSGDELLPPGAPPQPGKIYESNAYTLAALVREAGGQPIHLGIAADRAEAVQKRLDRAVETGAHLILSSAGVSVGAFDFVRSVVEKHGELGFWRVNMRPGKPLAFGNYRGVPFVGLPGNPVSAFVGFEVFVRPGLYKMMGLEGWQPVVRKAVLEEPVSSDGRESYLRAVVAEKDGALYARLTGHQGSGNQFSLVQANAFVVVPAGVKSLSPGAEVEILPIGD